MLSSVSITTECIKKIICPDYEFMSQAIIVHLFFCAFLA